MCQFGPVKMPLDHRRGHSLQFQHPPPLLSPLLATNLFFSLNKMKHLRDLKI